MHLAGLDHIDGLGRVAFFTEYHFIYPGPQPR
jgi:hypothetical protein